MGEGDFRPSTVSRPLKLEIYDYFPDATQHAKFQGATSTWCAGQIARLTSESFCVFLLLHRMPTLNTSS